MRSLPTLNKQEPSFAVMYVSGLQSTTNSGYNVKVGRFVDIAEWYASSNQWSWQTLLLCLGNRTSLGLYVGLGARELARWCVPAPYSPVMRRAACSGRRRVHLPSSGAAAATAGGAEASAGCQLEPQRLWEANEQPQQCSVTMKTAWCEIFLMTSNSPE
jgi:hypothetical protein